jgi:threonine dehydratase
MIDYRDVLDAARRIDGRVHRTPVLRSRLIDRHCGRELYFKCENLQRGGAFKIRGATNKLVGLGPEERGRGVVAFSSGNHAQAVALASAELGVDATIVMPDDAPASKVAATKAYGARVVSYDRLRDDREAVAAEIVDRERRVLVPPYDDPLIMAGQGTAALELLADVPGLDAVVVPVGGGGLLAGTSVAVRGIDDAIRVFGVEPETANDTALSLARGERITIPPPSTIADGARPQAPGRLTFPVIQQFAEAVLLVPDVALVEGMKLLLGRAKVLVEPTGALGLAAILTGALPADAARVGVILSGGNVDLDVLAGLIG